MSVKKFNTYRSELECSTEAGGEYGLPEKVTVVLAEDYDGVVAELERWKNKHRIEVSWACAKVEESADRIIALESALTTVANKCSGELRCPGYKLAADLGLSAPAKGANANVDG